MIKRYRFTNKEVADTKLATLSEEVLKHTHVVRIGLIVDEEALFENNELIKEATYKEGYAVDILYTKLTESPYGFKQYEVEPLTPSHNFA